MPQMWGDYDTRIKIYVRNLDNCVAIHFALLKTEDLITILEEKMGPVELVDTRRYCHQKKLQ